MPKSGHHLRASGSHGRSTRRLLLCGAPGPTRAVEAVVDAGSGRGDRMRERATCRWPLPNRHASPRRHPAFGQRAHSRSRRARAYRLYRCAPVRPAVGRGSVLHRCHHDGGSGGQHSLHGEGAPQGRRRPDEARGDGLPRRLERLHRPACGARRAIEGGRWRVTSAARLDALREPRAGHAAAKVAAISCQPSMAITTAT